VTTQASSANAPDFFNSLLEGDGIAHQALCEVAAHLTASNETLSPALQKYVVTAASQLMRGKRGNPALNSLRDDAILDAVEIVMKFGFKATRNDASRGHESACSIVALALGECGVARSESQVKKIWEEQLKKWKAAGIAR
jgi:hypothetical protein